MSWRVPAPKHQGHTDTLCGDSDFAGLKCIRFFVLIRKLTR